MKVPRWIEGHYETEEEEEIAALHAQMERLTRELATLQAEARAIRAALRGEGEK